MCYVVCRFYVFFFFKQKTAYEMRISDWSSDVCSSDLVKLDYGNGTLRLTTRQSFQLHGIIKSNLKRTMQAINACLLDTIAACGDVNRNVMCSPNPYRSALHAETYELARQVGTYLLPRSRAYHEIWLDREKVVDTSGPADDKDGEEPIYGRFYLPRKFKIV